MKSNSILLDFTITGYLKLKMKRRRQDGCLGTSSTLICAELLDHSWCDCTHRHQPVTWAVSFEMPQLKSWLIGLRFILAHRSPLYLWSLSWLAGYYRAPLSEFAPAAVVSEVRAVSASWRVWYFGGFTHLSLKCWSALPACNAVSRFLLTPG